MKTCNCVVLQLQTCAVMFIGERHFTDSVTVDS